MVFLCEVAIPLWRVTPGSFRLIPPNILSFNSSASALLCIAGRRPEGRRDGNPAFPVKPVLDARRSNGCSGHDMDLHRGAAPVCRQEHCLYGCVAEFGQTRANNEPKFVSYSIGRIALATLLERGALVFSCNPCEASGHSILTLMLGTEFHCLTEPAWRAPSMSAAPPASLG